MSSPLLKAAATAAIFLFVVGVPAVQAAGVRSDGTTATFTSDAGQKDEVTIATIDADTVEFTVEDDTLEEGANCAQVKDDTTRCDATQRVVLDLRDGNDHVNADHVTTHAVTARGGDGHDLLIGGLEPDELTGGPGNDTVYGVMEGLPAGADRLDGGPDDDTFVQPSAADDVVGGTGADRVTVIVADVTVSPMTPVNMSITLDDQPNDGRDGEGANVRSDVEHVASYLTETMENGTDAHWGSDPVYYAEGSLTARGTAGPNTIDGATGNDDLDGLGGNDVVSAGIGDDRVNSIDGYADRVVCGPGNDTVTADTLDDVSETCETVERRDVGNANDTPEDAPPSVTLDAATPAVTATAADDHGVASVVFLDDDRVVCTDEAAPYTCDYRPRGEDVGRNTLTAIVTDTAGQTASDRRVLTIGKFAPAGVTLRVSKRRAAGRVVLPPEVTPALGCTGSVALKVKRGTRTATLRTRLKADCTYRARLKLRRRAQVQAIFAGNSVLSAERRSARVR